MRAPVGMTFGVYLVTGEGGVNKSGARLSRVRCTVCGLERELKTSALHVAAEECRHPRKTA